MLLGCNLLLSSTESHFLTLRVTPLFEFLLVQCVLLHEEYHVGTGQLICIQPALFEHILLMLSVFYIRKIGQAFHMMQNLHCRLIRSRFGLFCDPFDVFPMHKCFSIGCWSDLGIFAQQVDSKMLPENSILLWRRLATTSHHQIFPSLMLM